MYRAKRIKGCCIKCNESEAGETIEQKVRRILNNKEAITDGAPPIYTERSQGVLPETDIRTDRWEIALDAMDKVSKTTLAKREEALKEMNESLKNTPKEGDNTVEPKV